MEELLPDAGPGITLKGASFGVGKGIYYSLCVVSGWQYVEESGEWIKEHVLDCIGGGGCAALIHLPNVGLGDAPKDASLGLSRGTYYFSRTVSRYQYVETSDEWIEEHVFDSNGGGNVPP